MLSAYRRHLTTCKFESVDEKRCSCPVWCQGQAPSGEYLRKSLKVRSWESAQKIIRDMETGEHVDTETVASAGKKFLADCEARNLGVAQSGKYKLLVSELTGRFGDRTMGSIAVDDLRAYRESWTLSPITASKKLERLRTFFKFAVESNWIATNPARVLKAPKVKHSPTLPFSADEMAAIFKAVDSFGGLAVRREQLRTFILVLQYSGLRIGDATKLTRSDLSEEKLHLSTQKTGQAVWVPLPKHVATAIAKLPGERFFWSTGKGSLKSAVSVWQRTLAKIFKRAGITNGHAHRFRDTFAVSLLLGGVSLEDVAVLLGNSAKIVARHYSPWVLARQRSLEASVAQAWKVAS